MSVLLTIGTIWFAASVLIAAGWYLLKKNTKQADPVINDKTNVLEFKAGGWR